MPDTSSLSVFQTFDDKWDFMSDITWTHWSVFNRADGQFANGAPANVTTGIGMTRGALLSGPTTSSMRAGR